MKQKDKIKGGLADKKDARSFDPKALAEGTKIEMEHTSDKSIAKEIAMDHLMEDPNYYEKLKEIEKQDMLEITPDGKQEIVEGKEPLKKDPKKLKERWKNLKKNLNNIEAIMDLSSAIKLEDNQQPENAQQTNEEEILEQLSNMALEQDQDEMAQDETALEEQDDQEVPSLEEERSIIPEKQLPDDVNQSFNEEQEEQPKEDEYIDDEELLSEEGLRDASIGEEDFDQAAHEQELIDLLREEGYTDPEIAYIVHGHHSPELPKQDHIGAVKADALRSMSDIEADHARQLSELEREMKSKQLDLEHKHAQRMKDLEYESAKSSLLDNSEKEHKRQLMNLELERHKLELEKRKQEIALELEFKRRELELKLKHAEEAAKRKFKEKDLKKSEEIDEQQD